MIPSSPTATSARANASSSSRNIYTIFERAENVHRKLLYDLMSSVYEYILLTPVPRESNPETSTSVLSKYSSNESLFVRVHRCVEQIFLNGLRLHKPDKSPDIWCFIEALNWLNPTMIASLANSSLFDDANCSQQLPKVSRIRKDKALSWIFENLKNNRLMTKLKCLLSDAEHLVTCYEVTIAFFHSKKFVEAMFECLTALELHDVQLLTQIDRNLYTISANAVDWQFPDAFASSVGQSVVSESRKREKCNEIENCDSKVDNRHRKRSNWCTNSATNLNRNIAERMRKHSNRVRCKCKHLISVKIRQWVSLPDIRSPKRARKLFRTRSLPIRLKKDRPRLTAATLAINEKKLVPKSGVSVVKEDDEATALQPTILVKCDDIPIHTHRRQITRDDRSKSMMFSSSEQDSHFTTTKSTSNLMSLFGIFPSKTLTGSCTNSNESSISPGGAGDFITFAPRYGEKIENRFRRSIFEDPVPDSSSSGPRQLSISPKCNSSNPSQIMPTHGQSLSSYLQESQRFRISLTDLERENAHFFLSDAIIGAIEEIKCGRCEPQKEKQIREASNVKRKKRNRRLRNWVDTDSHRFVSSDSENSLSATSNSSSGSELSFASNDCDTSEASSPGDLKRLKIFTISSQSVNDSHAAYAEWGENSIESMSAEGIALSLISKFKDHQLPRAAELLATGTNYQTNVMNRMYDMVPDEINHAPYTRGTAEWAPPRPQIIFTRHLPLERRTVIQMQNSRCAGCGMFVAASLNYSLRYCEYLGKYHCTGCHRNQISTIPARVLERWDFSCHPVSAFSYHLLEQIWKVPLFRVPDLNKELYGRVRALRYARSRRILLKYIFDFVSICRFPDEIKDELECIPAYIYNEPDVWSMKDFVDIRSGSFSKTLNEIILRGEQHVYQCDLCTAHGFICEYCRDKEIIFPWQTKITRCAKCGSCSHSACWKNECSKCQRLEKRKKN